MIKICNIIVFPGFLVGGEEIIRLKLEKTKAARIIAVITRKKFMAKPFDKNITPKIKGIEENITPYMNELHILPIRIVLIDIGQVVKRSKVPRIVSHGKIIGPIEDEVKKITITIIPEIRYGGAMVLPTVKAKNNIIGKNIPCINTGGLL